MAKRKAARRKAVSTKRKAGRSRSASKKVARRKVAKKTVRAARKGAARKGAARKVAAKKRQIKAKAVRKRVKTTRKATTASRARSTKGLVKRAAPVIRKVAKPAAPVLKKAASSRTASAPAASSPKPKAGRAPIRTAPGLNRERRTIRDDDIVQTPPSSLDFDRTASAARSGRRELRDKYAEHTETSPALTGGDVDADWESASSVGDEAPGGDNPTPDQDLVDDIGRALGVEYQDNEELKGEAKIAKRDRNRWELDPASSDDWEDR